MWKPIDQQYHKKPPKKKQKQEQQIFAVIEKNDVNLFACCVDFGVVSVFLSLI